MKKLNAFTLAEVMITLVVIGVVAALTVPHAQMRAREIQYVNSLKKFYTNSNQAFKYRMAQNGLTDLQESKIIGSINGSGINDRFNQPEFTSELRKIYRVMDVYQKGTYSGLKSCTYLDESGESPANNNYTFTLVDGAVVHLDMTSTPEYPEFPLSDIRALGGKLESIYGTMDIDINGDNKPNKWGLDCFRFVISNKGLVYPYMGKDYAIMKAGSGWRNSSFYWNGAHDECSKPNGHGQSCAAKIIENDWSMNY